MKEGDDYRLLPGGKKKFLFTGSSQSRDHNSDEFLPKATTTCSSPQSLPLNLDSVWSIKNVGLTSSSSKIPLSEPGSIKSEGFNKNAGAAVYSRYGVIRETPNHATRNSSSAGSKVRWSSSGFNLSQQPPFHSQSPTNNTHVRVGSKHLQQPSPLDHDSSEF